MRSLTGVGEPYMHQAPLLNTQLLSLTISATTKFPGWALISPSTQRFLKDTTPAPTFSGLEVHRLWWEESERRMAEWLVL